MLIRNSITSSLYVTQNDGISSLHMIPVTTRLSFVRNYRTRTSALVEMKCRWRNDFCRRTKSSFFLQICVRGSLPTPCSTTPQSGMFECCAHLMQFSSATSGTSIHDFLAATAQQVIQQRSAFRNKRVVTGTIRSAGCNRATGEPSKPCVPCSRIPHIRSFRLTLERRTQQTDPGKTRWDYLTEEQRRSKVDYLVYVSSTFHSLFTSQ